MAEDGSIGWGQLSTYNADITTLVFHRQVARWAVGRDALDLAALVDAIPEREHKFPGSYLYRAIAGLDTGLWDWRGRREGKPVAALLGGSAGRVLAYASSMRRDITPEAEAERMLGLRGRHGFQAFKFRVGSECGHDHDEWPGRTESIVPALRQRLGPGATLLVDANSCYSPERAIEVGRMLEDYGIVHFEEPCPYWELEQTRQVTEALTIDVTGGEQDWDMQHWKRMVAMRVVDVIQPDVLYVGGMLRALRVAALGAAAGLTCTPHSANLSLVTLFTMHLLRAIPNAGPYLEFPIEGADYYPWQVGLLDRDPYAVTDGQVTVTDEPGWGAEPNAAWLAKSVRQVSEAAA